MANVPLPNTAAPAHTPAPRRSQGGRKKANPAADDAAYHGVSTSNAGGGGKRAATDKPEGEPRMKRKRVDMGMAGGNVGSSSNAPNSGLRRNERPVNADGKLSLVSYPLHWLVGRARYGTCDWGVEAFLPCARLSPSRARIAPEMSTGALLAVDWSNCLLTASAEYQIDFTTLPIEALYRYLAQFDVIPEVDPSPLTAQDPPPPSSLLQPRGERRSSSASPAPVLLPVTPANRPRRETSANVHRRRSSRLLEEDRVPATTPVLADIADFHGALASIAEKHFHQHSVKELDTLTSFISAVKAKGVWQGA